MLHFLRDSGCASKRKFLLFGAAVCRRIWPLLTDSRSQLAVEASEWHADGQFSSQDLRDAMNEAYRAWKDASAVPDDPGEPPDKGLYGSSRPWRQRPYEDDPVARRYLSPHRGIAVFHAAYAACMLPVRLTERVLSDAQEAVWFATTEGQRLAVAAEVQAQADLLRDLFGSLPFRGPPTIDPRWLRWNDGTVQRLAESAYQERTLPDGRLDHARLAILADALEEAGCTDRDILAHLRQQGAIHVVGCWAIDAVLEKG
jgi:hypothetical protein